MGFIVIYVLHFNPVPLFPSQAVVPSPSLIPFLIPTHPTSTFITFLFLFLSNEFKSPCFQERGPLIANIFTHRTYPTSVCGPDTSLCPLLGVLTSHGSMNLRVPGQVAGKWDTRTVKRVRTGLSVRTQLAPRSLVSMRWCSARHLSTRSWESSGRGS